MPRPELNQTMLKRLKKLSDQELLQKAQAFKVGNRVYSDANFQRNYDTVLFELNERGHLENRKIHSPNRSGYYHDKKEDE